MKNFKLFTTITFAFMMLVSYNVDAQKFRGLDKSPMDAASLGRGNKQLAIVYYGRPQLKGRTVGEGSVFVPGFISSSGIGSAFSEQMWEVGSSFYKVEHIQPKNVDVGNGSSTTPSPTFG